MTALPRKKTPREIDPLQLNKLAMSADDWKDYEEGWRLFNERQFWHAHEAWEKVWKRRPEESRIFFQGIIQLAAAYHLLVVKKRYGGMMRNFEKAEEKLKLFPHHFLLVNVARLLLAIDAARTEAQRTGEKSLDQFDLTLIPSVDVQ